MIPFSEQSDHSRSDRSTVRPSTALSRQQSSPRFWLLLVGGSIALHLLLIRWVGAMIQPSSRSAALPVDLISLPATSQAVSPRRIAAQSRQTVSPVPATVTGSHGVSQAQATFVPLRPPNRAIAEFIASGLAARKADRILAPAVKAPQPSAQPRLPQPETSPQPVAAQFSPPQLPSAAMSDPMAPRALSPISNSLPTHALVQSSPSPTPTPIPLASQPISQPVPDLSQPQPRPSPLLSQAEAIPTQIPSYLTANLTTLVPPVSQLEQPAQPQLNVRRFLTNSQLPPCTVTPEVLYFLGKTVAMRVTTNTNGQVMQTVTEESSQNLAYDELATCLVRNWDFKPATAQPTASRLFVWITIDHG